MQKQIFHFSLFTFHFFLYLCSRFPRNRWQEDRRVACYVALERYNKFNYQKENGFN